MDEHVIVELRTTIVDEQVRPWLEQSLYQSIRLSPGDFSARGLHGWDALYASRMFAHMLIDGWESASARFLDDAIAAVYDPYEPLDPAVFVDAVHAGYAPGAFAREAAHLIDRALTDHEGAYELGSIAAGTLDTLEQRMRKEKGF